MAKSESREDRNRLPPAYAKLQMRTAAEVCALIRPSQAAAELLTPDLTPAAYLNLLIARLLHSDTIRFLGAGLPKREAVWWACTCARMVLAPNAPSAAVAALTAAEAWVRQPTEENRRAAHALAEAAKLNSPASWAAEAVFWSGGSISAPGTPAIAAADTMLPAAVAGAILLAAVQNEPHRAEERYRAFIAAGLDIANGGGGRGGAKGPE